MQHQFAYIQIESRNFPSIILTFYFLCYNLFIHLDMPFIKASFYILYAFYYAGGTFHSFLNVLVFFLYFLVKDRFLKAVHYFSHFRAIDFLSLLIYGFISPLAFISPDVFVSVFLISFSLLVSHTILPFIPFHHQLLFVFIFTFE